MEVEIFRKRRRNHADRHIDLDEYMGLAIFIESGKGLDKRLATARIQQPVNHISDDSALQFVGNPRLAPSNQVSQCFLNDI